MFEQSLYHQITNLITLEAICEPVSSPLDASMDYDDLMFSYENLVDSLVVLVAENDRVIGYLALAKPADILADNQAHTLGECITPIPPSQILSADTPLLQALPILTRPGNWIFFVLKHDRFIGFVNPSHLDSPPFRLCLFALLSSLESLVTRVLKKAPQLSLQLLKEHQNYNKALRDYKSHNQQFSQKSDSKLPTDDLENDLAPQADPALLNFTYFSTKLELYTKLQLKFPTLPTFDPPYQKALNKLRNRVAHGHHFIIFPDSFEPELSNRPDAYIQSTFSYLIQATLSFESALQTFLNSNPSPL